MNDNAFHLCSTYGDIPQEGECPGCTAVAADGYGGTLYCNEHRQTETGFAAHAECEACEAERNGRAPRIDSEDPGGYCDSHLPGLDSDDE